MDYIVLYFILTNGGYIPPMDVRLTDSIIQCNLPGAIVGVQVNRLENPTIVLWPDPYIVDRHCEVDIAAKVTTLPNGEYHLATTTIGLLNGKPYLPHDPHTSVYWFKSSNTTGNVPKIINVRVQ